MDERARIELASTLLCRQPPCQPAPYRWQPLPASIRAPPRSERGALPNELRGGEMVCVAGFEPAISDFQGRRGRPGSPTHRWRPRQESNLHTSRLVAGRSSN